MAAAIEIRLEGFKETTARLRGFPDKLRSNYMRGGMRALVAQLRKGARRRLTGHTRTGALRRSIGVSTRVTGDLVTGKVYAGKIATAGKFAGHSAWYGHILEAGAKPHVIEPKNGKAVAFGGNVFARINRHPGVRAIRFMRDTATHDLNHGQRIFKNYVELRSNEYLSGSRR